MRFSFLKTRREDNCHGPGWWACFEILIHSELSLTPHPEGTNGGEARLLLEGKSETYFLSPPGPLPVEVLNYGFALGIPGHQYTAWGITLLISFGQWTGVEGRYPIEKMGANKSLPRPLQKPFLRDLNRHFLIQQLKFTKRYRQSLEENVDSFFLIYFAFCQLSYPPTYAVVGFDSIPQVLVRRFLEQSV